MRLPEQMVKMAESTVIEMAAVKRRDMLFLLLHLYHEAPFIVSVMAKFH